MQVGVRVFHRLEEWAIAVRFRLASHVKQLFSLHAILIFYQITISAFVPGHFSSMVTEACNLLPEQQTMTCSSKSSKGMSRSFIHINSSSIISISSSRTFCQSKRLSISPGCNQKIGGPRSSEQHARATTCHRHLQVLQRSRPSSLKMSQ